MEPVRDILSGDDTNCLKGISATQKKTTKKGVTTTPMMMWKMSLYISTWLVLCANLVVESILYNFFFILIQLMKNFMTVLWWIKWKFKFLKKNLFFFIHCHLFFSFFYYSSPFVELTLFSRSTAVQHCSGLHFFAFVILTRSYVWRPIEWW